MRVDFQFSIAGSVEVTEQEGTLEAAARLHEFQRSFQYSAENSIVKIDGITLGWKERPLTPLELMQLQMGEGSGNKAQYDPRVHGTADSPAEPEVRTPKTSPSGNPDAPQLSDEQILAERASQVLQGGPDSDGGV